MDAGTAERGAEEVGEDDGDNAAGVGEPGLGSGAELEVVGGFAVDVDRDGDAFGRKPFLVGAIEAAGMAELDLRGIGRAGVQLHGPDAELGSELGVDGCYDVVDGCGVADELGDPVDAGYGVVAAASSPGGVDAQMGELADGDADDGDEDGRDDVLPVLDDEGAVGDGVGGVEGERGGQRGDDAGGPAVDAASRSRWAASRLRQVGSGAVSLRVHPAS